ncbi:MAG: lamin tail domain-containing protein [Candidatus Magasanikbacteria bacterium]
MKETRWAWLIVVLIGSFFVFNQSQADSCATSTGWENIKINEISSFTSSDWVELYNLFDECIDLTGLKIWDTSTSTAAGTLSNITIPAHGYLEKTVGSRLGQTEDCIYLKSDDTTFDWICYSTSNLLSPTFATQTLARKIDGIDTNSDSDWALTVSSTPGAVNIITTLTTPPPGEGEEDTTTTTEEMTTDTSTLWMSLRLNEIMPAPTEGNEWLEIFNPTTSSLNLAGGYICDSRGANTTDSCKNLSGIIEAENFLVFNWTGYYLNNTGGDSVYLKNPEGINIDSISYDEIDEGYTYARFVDGAGNWAITTNPTPNATNIIITPIEPTPSSDGSSGSGSEITTNKLSTSKTSTTTSKTAATGNKDIIWKIKYPTKILIGSTTLFSAIGTMDTRGGYIDFTWDLNEEKTVTGTAINYTFASSGIHNIVVSATSTGGSVGNKNFKIRIYPTSTIISDIIISATLPNQSDDEGDEYIKIKNLSATTTDISFWKLLYKNQIYQLPRSTTIFAGDELTFYQPITKFTLNNNGGEIELRDNEDFLIDIFEYGKTKAGMEIGSDTSTPAQISVLPKTATPKITKPSYSGEYLGQTTIADARAAVNDSYAKVQGMVSVPPGILGSQYFYITDGASGIQIYQYKKDFPPLAIGDHVTVSGITSEASGIKRLKLKSKNDIDILATNQNIKPTDFTIEELSEDGLGALVKISGEITEIKTNYMYIDNDAGEALIYFKTGAQIDKKKFTEGEKVEVIGILEQSKTDIQILPRNQNDIISLGPSQNLLKKQGLVSEPNETKNTAEGYLTATAGGLTAFIFAFLARARGALIMGFIKRSGNIALRIIKRG